MPKVTVLLPVFDGAAVLGPAIESVLGQTYRDFELLVVDDGSRDDSARVVRSYPDERIRVLSNESNIGQVASLNRGLEESRGAYVARLDQDDVCLPDRLARQTAVLDAEQGVAVVGTWMDVVDERDRLVWRFRDTIETRSEFVFRLLTAPAVPLAHPTVMFRRDAVREVGGYDGRYELAEDQDLWRRLALAGWDARLVAETLLRYRVHEGQQSARRAVVQSENNARSHELFLGELAPRAPVRELRLLLTDDPALWRTCADAGSARALVKGLESLLARAPGRLGLTPAEAAALERGLRLRVGEVSRRGWRYGLLLHWRASPRLTAAAYRRAPLMLARAALTYALSPALALARRLKRTRRPARRELRGAAPDPRPNGAGAPR